MRALSITISVLFFVSLGFGQDGSDMNYVAMRNLDRSYIGRKLHLDFNERSFAAFDSKRAIDTVTIELDGKKIRFIERRVDDGYNNWFSRQYLESVDQIDGLKLRIKEFELLKLTEKEIAVKAFFVTIGKDGQELPGKSFTKDLSFARKEIIEVLFKAND